MRRTFFFVLFLLFAINPVFADSGKKLTNSELKHITSHVFFAAGHSMKFGVSFHVTYFPDGTREVYWHDGIPGHVGHIVKSKWWLKGDTVCYQNADWIAEKCDEWRKNGQRIETWGFGVQNGYFYILPRA